ncbi:unnamed protein product [Amoebophrya sp. A25]|nr:unnamed protein product [Amoebophrya sp. A25]|eukprot:GSA25T00013315001.1
MMCPGETVTIQRSLRYTEHVITSSMFLICTVYARLDPKSARGWGYMRKRPRIAGQGVGTRCRLLVSLRRSRTESYQELAWMIVDVEAVGTCVSSARVEVAPPCTFAYLKVCRALPVS